MGGMKLVLGLICVLARVGNADEVSAEAQEALPNAAITDYPYAVPAYVTKALVDKLGSPLPDDVFVCSWPKSGTNWVKQIVHAIRIRGDAKQVEAEAKTDLSDIVPWLEADTAVDHDKLPKPRVYQSHLHYEHLPKGGKIIYAMRDLPDVVTSFWKFVQQFEGFLENNSVDTVAELMMGGHLYYGFWEDSMASYLKHRDSSDILFVKFEDLKKNLRSEIQRIAQFLGESLTESEMIKVEGLASLEFMKKNAWRISGKDWAERVTGVPVNPEYSLVKEGVSGHKFTPEMTAKMEKYFIEKVAPVLNVSRYADFKVPAISKKESVWTSIWTSMWKRLVPDEL